MRQIFIQFGDASISFMMKLYLYHSNVQVSSCNRYAKNNINQYMFNIYSVCAIHVLSDGEISTFIDGEISLYTLSAQQNMQEPFHYQNKSSLINKSYDFIISPVPDTKNESVLLTNNMQSKFHTKFLITLGCTTNDDWNRYLYGWKMQVWSK